MKSHLLACLLALNAATAEPIKMSFTEAMQRLVAQNRDLKAARQNLEPARGA
jgi:hypothetical protein